MPSSSPWRSALRGAPPRGAGSILGFCPPACGSPAGGWDEAALSEGAADAGTEAGAEAWGAQAATTPTGVAAFAEDVAIRRYGEQAYNIVHWSDFDRGGHFAAMEVPDLFVGDVRKFLAPLR